MINLLIYIVSTILTYVLGILAKKFKWNEQVPIPVQNILVGTVVFFIAWVFTNPTNPQELAQQIFHSLSGVGTATLVYDNIKAKKGE